MDASPATTKSAASQAAAVRSQRRRRGSAIRDPRRPPRTAPARNAASAVNDRAIENSDTPAAAKPRNTTFPVMFAVKTLPNPSTLTASTMPVTKVRTSKNRGKEYCSFNESAACVIGMLDSSLPSSPHLPHRIETHNYNRDSTALIRPSYSRVNPEVLHEHLYGI